MRRSNRLGDRNFGRRTVGRRTATRDDGDHPAVEARDVHRTLGHGGSRVTALDGVSLAVDLGEWVAVTGPSGCGKTTLLHALGGLDRIDRGQILLDGRPFSSKSEAERARHRRRDIAYVFQQYNLLSDLTALDNVTLPLRMVGVGRREARRRAGSLLERLGLGERADGHPASLSGGEQQRVALARALVVEPLVLLADEPTGALDSEAGALVLDLFRDQHRNGQTIVMVTHDHRVAAAADRVLSMIDGRLGEEHRLRAVHGSDLSNLLSLEID